MANHDEAVNLDNLVNAVVTVTDGDDDTATDSVDIGDKIRFEDDGPTAAIQSTAATVTVDESAGLQTGSDGATATEDDNDNEVAGTTTFDKEGDATTVTLAALFGGLGGGADLDPAQYALAEGVVTSTGGDAGADGQKSKVYSLAIQGGDGTDSQLDTTDGKSISLYKVGDLVVGRYDADGNGSNETAAFAIAIDQAGRVATAQFVSLDHPTSGAPSVANHDEAVNLDNLVNAVVTLTDGDDDTATDSVDIGDKIRFEDDGPTATGTAVTGEVDEDGLSNGNDDSATGDLDADNGVNDDDDGNEAAITGSVAGIFSPGADGLFEYTLSTDTDNLAQNLTSQGGAVKYAVSGTTLTAYVDVGTAGNGYQEADREVFTLGLTAATGAYTFTLLDQLDHLTLDGGAGDNEENDLTLQLGTILRVTDGDGDTATAAAEKLQIVVDDDTPVVLAKSNLIYANASNPPPAGDPGGTGVFAYSIGADDRVGTTYTDVNSDFVKPITLTGTVGTDPDGAGPLTNAITAATVTWFSETDTEAVFNVDFTYVSNPTSGGTTTVNDAKLTFDKDAGTYNLTMPEIESFSILQTSTVGNFLQGYQLNSTTTQNSNPPVSVMRLASDFFVQFEGFGVINGTPKTFEYDAATGLFSNDRRYVTVSSASIGAASDTLQSNEVIDLDFFTQNPFGVVEPAVPRTTSKAVFIEMEQVGPGAGKDLLVVLKLVDDNNAANTVNRTFIVGNSTGNDDIFNADLPTYGFVAAKQNGIVVFESNDYNFSGENYSVRGMQVVTSTQNVSGSGYHLNGAIDDPTTQAEEGGIVNTNLVAFGGETTEGSNEPIKIIDLGFLTSTTPDSQLVFNVAVKDADGDATGSQTLGVTIVGGSGVTASAGVDTFVISAAPVDGLLQMVTTVIDGGFASGVDKLKFPVAGSGAYAENLADALSVGAFVAAANTALIDGNVSFYFGVVGGNGYLAYDANNNGISSIVNLVGVTDMAATDIIV